MIILKPGKTKKQLLKYLKKLKSKFKNEILEHEVEITEIEDGYEIFLEKNILFINLSAKVKITAEDEEYILEYTTKNIPESRIQEATDIITEELESY